MTLRIMTIAGTETTLDDQALQDFRAVIRGDVFTETEDGYEEALQCLVVQCCLRA